jgi:hypothetical protein
MILKLAPLLTSELKLLADALRLANTSEKIPDSEILDFEKQALGYIAATRRNRIGFQGRKIWDSAEKMGTAAVRASWAAAGRNALWIISQGRNPVGVFCPIPPISLPSKNPIVLVGSRSDFFDWLFARAVANSQWLGFVKCKLCGKIKLRRRARVGSTYCSPKCQRDAGIERLLAGKDETDLEKWLVNLPKPLPARFKMQAARLEKLNADKNKANFDKWLAEKQKSTSKSHKPTI